MAPPWYLLLLVALVGARECPDGTTCGEKTVCCLLPESNVYGCCPQDEIVSSSLPMLTLDVPCTEHAGCPEEYSCVSTPQGGASCCPLGQGISCKDGHHCCPTNSQCSEDGHSCIPAATESAIICPDGSSECPNDATCCQMADQTWGCCPLTQATCCSDHIHCCPHDTQCDLEHGSCASDNGRLPLSKKFPAKVKLLLSEKVARTNCSDGSTCPDGSTCCELSDRSFGCCPMISAVCCGDHIHCCPTGTTCDLSQKKCTSKDSETPMAIKTPALRGEATVKCDDTEECPGSQTCCRLASGDWGCCPFENAVCCPDKASCCPSGYTCTASGCESSTNSIPWLEKTLALEQQSKYISSLRETSTLEQQSKTTVRCDATASCPGSQTCCRLASGDWGCCPYPSAVCCADGAHCCPSGSRCTAFGSCQSNAYTIPWLEKTPALKQQATVKCDDTAECPGSQTCCRLASGEWGCCPYENAVCCPDKAHCCPSGFTCTASGSCQSNSRIIPWHPKTPVVKQQSTTVRCDDATACTDDSTCCRLPSGDWGCCPFKQAVCCSDHQHCCPSGYTCDLEAASCHKPEEVAPMKILEAVAPVKNVEAVEPGNRIDYVWCDGSHACYDGQTCCVGYYGAWTCCPYTMGVCCPDRIHCCPYGHACLNAGAQCSRSGNLRWDLGLKKKPFL